LKKHDFRIYLTSFHVGEKTRILIELDQTLPDHQEIQGPKVFHGEKHLAQFRSKYDNTFIQGSRLCARTDREYTDAKKLLKEFLSNDLESKGIPSHVAEQMENYRFTDALNDDKEWLKYLAEEFHI
jgi:tRNA nucleotidyltransferase (CCA-adding enzyme)